MKNASDDPLLNSQIEVLSKRFEFHELLGKGGTAVVYRATDRDTRRTVALKLLRPDVLGDPEALPRLEREAALVAPLDHPRLVRLYGFHPLPPHGAALSLEFAPGGTLKALMERRGKLSEADVQPLLRDLLEALVYTHQHGVVHRDIKPENVYLDRDGRALLGDFGIARGDTSATLTIDGTSIGTPAYMSPEQIDGGRVDARSDLYSLGLLVWSLLVGQAPWAGETLFSIIVKQKTEKLPAIYHRSPDVSQRLVDVVDWCLEKDRSNRPDSAQDVLRALDATVERSAGQARRQPTPPPLPDEDTIRWDPRSTGPVASISSRSHQTSPPNTRNRSTAIVVGTVGVLLTTAVAGVIGYSNYSRRADQQRVASAAQAESERLRLDSLSRLQQLATPAAEGGIGAIVTSDALRSAQILDGAALPLVRWDSLPIEADGSQLRLAVHGNAPESSDPTSLDPAILTVALQDASSGPIRILMKDTSRSGPRGEQHFESLFTYGLANAAGTPIVVFQKHIQYAAASTSYVFLTRIFALVSGGRLNEVAIKDAADDSLSVTQGVKAVMSRSGSDTISSDGVFRRDYQLWLDSDPSCCPCGGRVRVHFRLSLVGLEAMFVPDRYESIEPPNSPTCKAEIFASTNVPLAHGGKTLSAPPTRHSKRNCLSTSSVTT